MISSETQTDLARILDCVFCPQTLQNQFNFVSARLGSVPEGTSDHIVLSQYQTTLIVAAEKQHDRAREAALKRKDGCTQTTHDSIVGTLRVELASPDRAHRGFKPHRVFIETENGTALLSVVSGGMSGNSELFRLLRRLDGTTVSVKGHLWASERGLQAYVSSPGDIAVKRQPKPKKPTKSM